mgnify:CR=1 FL=1
MANIMINENCNQRCPYCFAAEFVNIRQNNISYQAFVKAVDFVIDDDDKNFRGRIGIIGGEPLLHPEFDKFITYLINKEQIKRITIFTNGVLIKEHLEVLLNDKVTLLINVNSIEDVGKNNYYKTEEAIDLLVNKYGKKNHLTIGLNIYKNMDYSFFINMAEKYNLNRVRLSIVVPAYGTQKKGLRHFMELKDTVLKLTKGLLVRDIKFKFDCNLPTSCLWSDEELNDMQLMGLCSLNRDLIPLGHSICSPVIDILPDLTIIRCFGLSDVSKVNIDDFDSIKALREYYIEHFDIPLSKKGIDNKCNTCKLFPDKCFGGCLANRI